MTRDFDIISEIIMYLANNKGMATDSDIVSHFNDSHVSLDVYFNLALMSDIEIVAPRQSVQSSGQPRLTWFGYELAEAIKDGKGLKSTREKARG